MLSAHTPRRVVSLQPSATAILEAIGHLDRLVACTKYCVDVCPAVSRAGIAIISDSWSANAQEIAQTAPDLVIAAVPYQEKAVAEILKAGARFLGLAPKTLADIYMDIATIAGAVSANQRGESVIEAMQQKIADTRRQAANSPRLRVFCEEWGKPLIASQPWVRELVEAAGGEFLGVPGAQCAAGEITRLDPEVIIAAWCGAGDRVPLEKIVAERRWRQTPAAQCGRVFCIRDEYLNTPAPTLLHGLQALAWAIHPEIFPTRKESGRLLP